MNDEQARKLIENAGPELLEVMEKLEQLTADELIVFIRILTHLIEVKTLDRK